MKLALFLLSLAAVLFLAAACSTGTTAAAVTISATAVALVDAIAPLLPPEQVAALKATAHSIDGTVQATAHALNVVADAIGNLRGNTAQQIAEVNAGLQKAVVQVATMPGREELYLVGGGTAAASTGASRMLSRMKHGR